MSRKVQIVNMEAAESERDVVVTTHDGQTHTIRPGRTLDIETGDVIGVSHRGLNVEQEPEPIDEVSGLNSDLMGVVDPSADANDQQWTEEEVAAMKAAGPGALIINKIEPAVLDPDGQPAQDAAPPVPEEVRPVEDGEFQEPVEPGPENPVDPVEEPVTTAENMIGVAPEPTEPEAQA
ncbi:hypothetical protein [Mesorhizobium onobrychidis]|uniref:Uncharacterized protein n=1 Tax=Mesorhizobium onobrychidis TaxID=2775404 RepID=A0ABY5QXB1_9HYPH|nr:hypothetical protein [Mesorhizobium onobrychidis]UVC14712.1 hypothetical protein IHQ72_29535 [Mesorhizobium onobrychidis]